MSIELLLFLLTSLLIVLLLTWCVLTLLDKCLRYKKVKKYRKFVESQLNHSDWKRDKPNAK